MYVPDPFPPQLAKARRVCTLRATVMIFLSGKSGYLTAWIESISP